jgi:hypothetical protein
MLQRYEDNNSEKKYDQSSSILLGGKSPRRMPSGAGPRVLRTKTKVSYMHLIEQTEALTPFGLDTEEDPDPASKNLKQFHHEDAAFQVVEVVQMWRELETPSTTEHQVHADSTIVHLLGMEVAIATQGPWMLRVVSLSCCREQGQIPILCDIPVERVEGIDKDEEQPAGCVSEFLDVFKGRHTIGGTSQFQTCQSWLGRILSSRHSI